MESNSPQRESCSLSQGSSGQNEEQIVLSALERSYFNPDSFKSNWRPTVEKTFNVASLEKKFKEKKDELARRGHSANELRENYGFLAVSSESEIESIIQDGLQTNMSAFNMLGPGHSGVYVFLHADLCLSHFEFAHLFQQEVKLVVFKFYSGKKHSIPASGPCPVNVTPGHDSHSYDSGPSGGQPLIQQCAKSLIYLYETDNEGSPVSCPRHSLPVGIVTMKKVQPGENGVPVPMECSEPEPARKQVIAEKFAKFPGLQDVIDRINSRPVVKAPMVPQPISRKRPFEIPSSDGACSIAERKRRIAENTKLQAVIERINKKCLIDKPADSLEPPQPPKPQTFGGYSSRPPAAMPSGRPECYDVPRSSQFDRGGGGLPPHSLSPRSNGRPTSYAVAKPDRGGGGLPPHSLSPRSNGRPTSYAVAKPAPPVGYNYPESKGSSLYDDGYPSGQSQHNSYKSTPYRQASSPPSAASNYSEGSHFSSYNGGGKTFWSS